jgi:hypothetical protein
MGFETKDDLIVWREYVMQHLGWTPLFGFDNVTETIRHIDIVANGVHHSWFIPAGSWAINDPSMVALQMDVWPNTGNFQTLPYGDPGPLGWTLIKRNTGVGGGAVPMQQLVSVQDMCTGFAMNNIPGSGNIMRMIWKERYLAIDPPHPRAVFLDGAGVPSFSTVAPWRFTNSPPNGIVVADPGIPGAVMELWRWRYRNGIGRALPTLKPNPQQPEGWGQRFLPWARGPFPATGSPFIAAINDIFGGSSVNKSKKERAFKACYYHPTLMARSSLSVETIRSNFRGFGDRMGNTAGPSKEFVRGRLFWIDR